MATLDPTRPDHPIYFDAVLSPNRSLPRRGFWLLMAVLILALGSLGYVFSSMGAWPVAGFCGLEVLLVWGAFHLNYRSGRMHESVHLDNETLTVRRVVPNRPVRQWRFEPSWVRVTMDNPPHQDSRLELSSHGRTIAIGDFLTPEERLEIAVALRQAISDWRAPPSQTQWRAT